MLGRKSLLIVITHYLTDILGFIGLVVLAKLWGDFSREAIGIIGFAMSFISLFGILTDFGFSGAHVKRVSEGKDLGTCIGTFAAIKLLLTSLMVVSVFVAIYIWKNVLQGDFYDATTESIIIIMVFYSIFTNLQMIVTQTFIGKGEIAKLQTTKLFENIVHVPLSIIVALAGVNVMGRVISPAVTWPEFLQPIQRYLAEHATGSLAMTYVFGILATFLVGMWFMRRDPIKKPSLPLAKNYFSFALPIAISSVVSTIAMNIDKIMIGYFWASENVGDYFVVQRITGFIAILHLSVSTVLFPTISKQHSSKDLKGVAESVHSSERYISMIMIPPLVVIFVFSASIVNVMFDSSYLPAAPVLIVMVLYAFVRGMTAPYGCLIVGMNRADISAKFGITVCITNIILNYILIPENGLLSSFGINGATGAALSTVISFSIPFIGERIIAKRLIGIKLLQSHTPRHIVAGIVMGLSLYFIAYRSSLFPDIRWYTLIFFAGIGLIIYIAVLFLLKEFKKQDFNFFLDIVHPKEMFSYMKSELTDKKDKE